MLMNKNGEQFKPLEDNIFGLENPESFSCSMRGYLTGHAMLWLEAWKTNTQREGRIFLGFAMPVYIDLPVRWENANFCVASSEECIELMGPLGMIGNFSDSMLKDIVKGQPLFTVTTSYGYKARIIATGISSSTDRPPRLHGF